MQAAAAFDYSLMAMNVLERVLAMLLHIGLTVNVYYGVVNGKKIFLPLAILLHFLVDGCLVVVAHYFTSYWVIYGILLVETAAVALLAYAIWKRNAKKEQSDADQAV